MKFSPRLPETQRVGGHLYCGRGDFANEDSGLFDRTFSGSGTFARPIWAMKKLVQRVIFK